MTEKNSRKRNKVKVVILAAALSVSMMFAVTACGSSTDTNSQQAASVQQESSLPDTTAATQSSTTAAADVSSETADGTYVGKITSISDTSITVSVMGSGMQGAPGAGNSAQTPGADKPSDKAPAGGSGTQPGGDGKGGPKDGAGQGGSGMQPGNGGSMEAPQGQEMTFTVRADQISGLASGDMVTVTVANGTVSSIEKAQAPESAADASASE